MRGAAGFCGTTHTAVALLPCTNRFKKQNAVEPRALRIQIWVPRDLVEHCPHDPNTRQCNGVPDAHWRPVRDLNIPNLRAAHATDRMQSTAKGMLTRYGPSTNLLRPEGECRCHEG